MKQQLHPQQPYSGFTKLEEMGIRFITIILHAWGSAIIASHLFVLNHWLLCLPYYLLGAVASVMVAHYLLARFGQSREVLRRFKAFEYVVDLRVRPLHLVGNAVLLSITTYFVLFPITYGGICLFQNWYLSLDNATSETFSPFRYWIILFIFIVLFVFFHPYLSEVGRNVFQNNLEIRMCSSPEEFLPILQEAKFQAERAIERTQDEERLSPLQVVQVTPTKQVSLSLPWYERVVAMARRIRS